MEPLAAGTRRRERAPRQEFHSARSARTGKPLSANTVDQYLTHIRNIDRNREILKVIQLFGETKPNFHFAALKARKLGFYSPRSVTADVEIWLRKLWRQRNYWTSDRCCNYYTFGGKLPDIIFDAVTTA